MNIPLQTFLDTYEQARRQVRDYQAEPFKDAEMIANKAIKDAQVAALPDQAEQRKLTLEGLKLGNKQTEQAITQNDKLFPATLFGAQAGVPGTPQWSTKRFYDALKTPAQIAAKRVQRFSQLAELWNKGFTVGAAAKATGMTPEETDEVASLLGGLDARSPDVVRREKLLEIDRLRAEAYYLQSKAAMTGAETRKSIAPSQIGLNESAARLKAAEADIKEAELNGWLSPKDAARLQVDMKKIDFDYAKLRQDRVIFDISHDLEVNKNLRQWHEYGLKTREEYNGKIRTILTAVDADLKMAREMFDKLNEQTNRTAQVRSMQAAYAQTITELEAKRAALYKALAEADIDPKTGIPKFQAPPSNPTEASGYSARPMSINDVPATPESVRGQQPNTRNRSGSATNRSQANSRSSVQSKPPPKPPTDIKKLSNDELFRRLVK